VQDVGVIGEIYRYPVKSMAGEKLDTADLGWHGLEGDRRAAFVRSGDHSGFPWLTASRLPSLLGYVPLRDPSAHPRALPSTVRTPKGEELDLRSDTLTAEIAASYGAPVTLLEVSNGIFDDAPISFITRATIAAIAAEADVPADVRRFRPNLVVESNDSFPFTDDAWVGRTVRVGAGDDAPEIAICLRDLRCVVVNIDPEGAGSSPGVLRAAARLHSACAGVYGTVVKTGRIARGDHLYVL
jgi:uncharacterized protein YcbX